MRISTDGCDSFRQFPIFFDERGNKTSETHIEVDGNIFCFTIRGDFFDWIACSVRVIWVWCVYTDGLRIYISFHFWKVHFVVFIKANYSNFNSEVIASFEGCCMSSFAYYQVGFFYSFFFHFIFSICKNGHNDRLSSTWVGCSTRLPFLVFEVEGLGCHVDHLILHLLKHGKHLEV